MRARRALTLGLVGLVGCAAPEATVRTERGPLLRNFHRPVVVDGAVTATASVAWPNLVLKVAGEDVCRDEEVSEYAEDTVTERSVPSAGPALSTGIVLTLAGAIAFGVSYAVSNTPDTSVIDRSGHYGPALSTLVRGWSLLGVGVGVPALVVGIVGFLQRGEDVRHVKVEQIVGQKDEPCHRRPLSGPVTLLGPSGPLVSADAVAGVASFDRKGVTAPVQTVSFANREVELDAASSVVVEAFTACAQLEAETVGSLAELGDGALIARARRLNACRSLRPDEVSQALEAVKEELARRPAKSSPGAFGPGAEPSNFEDVVSAYSPRLFFELGSADLSRLDDPKSLTGQSALVDGVVVEGLSQSIGVVKVGERELYVFLPPRRAWGGDFAEGTHIEAVVIMAGSQTVGERTLPLVRAVWMRPSP